MPDISFTNQQTVHVTHSLGTLHVPVYVEAEGFERIVEVQYGNGFFDVVFGRVMAYGLVSYSGGAGGLVLLSTPGSAGTAVKPGQKTSPTSSFSGNPAAGALPQNRATSGSGIPAAGSAGILS